MANSEVLQLVIQSVQSTVEYMLPIVGFLAGANFVLRWLFQILFGAHNGTKG